ncbi:hypothetical protein B0O99DRAFT_625769 [Bisporella sp. PMI_857]|nr:hypothetical protein B0O99DRAFT_625769 [Bisporella sp. PMI_857]
MDASSSFPKFSELPTELRLVIWRLALPPPRIVHLQRIDLWTDDDSNWWKRVRSDKRIVGPAIVPDGTIIKDEDEDYGEFELSRRDAEELEKQIAARRLLIPDDKYKGTMSRKEAKAMLQRVSLRRYPARDRRYNYATGQTPAILFGYKSEHPVPSLFFVSREARHVASKVYTNSFSALGAIPQTYFDGERDWLYLDLYSANQLSSQLAKLRSMLEDGTVLDSFAHVQNLAVSYHFDFHPICLVYQTTESWLRDLHRIFPRLKRLRWVSAHYSSRPGPYVNPYGFHKEFTQLKFVSCKTSPQGIRRLNGYLLTRDPIVHNRHPEIKWQPCDDPNRWLDESVEYAHSLWGGGDHNKHMPKVPAIDYKTILWEAEESRLLRQARALHLKYGEGTWYINPDDPTDFQDSPDDEIDNELAELLDWAA